MPAYAWLESAKVDMDSVPVKAKAMQSLGVPYFVDEVKNAKEVYLRQAEQVVATLAKDGVSISPESELVALIAYMQRLGTDIKIS